MDVSTIVCDITWVASVGTGCNGEKIGKFILKRSKV
jgi:hypothetical protein